MTNRFKNEATEAYYDEKYDQFAKDVEHDPLGHEIDIIKENAFNLARSLDMLKHHLQESVSVKDFDMGCFRQHDKNLFFIHKDLEDLMDRVSVVRQEEKDKEEIHVFAVGFPSDFFSNKKKEDNDNE